MGSKRCIQIMGYAKGSEVVSICSIVISRVLQIGGVYLAIKYPWFNFIRPIRNLVKTDFSFLF